MGNCETSRKLMTVGIDDEALNVIKTSEVAVI